MTQCWQEGALRAYLDGELPPEDVERVAAHLGNCTVCDSLFTELSGRAAHVSALLELLPDADFVVPHAPSLPHRGANWVSIAVALAAGLALAAYLLPARQPRAMLVPPGPASVPAPTATAAAALTLAKNPALTGAMNRAMTPVPVERFAPRRPRRVSQNAPDPNYFVALDDEPFESGVIMRVDVTPGNVQADIVFGPDGRARAFRLVNATQRNF